MSTVQQIDVLLSGVIDPNTGLPVSGGSVEFYEPGTDTPKNVWTEAAKSNAYTSYDLNAAGATGDVLWGDGCYDVLIKNSSGVEVVEWQGVYFTKSDFETTTMAVDYTQVYDDDAIIFSSSAVADKTLTLLAAGSWADKSLYVFNANETYDLTITPSSGTIDGASDLTLAAGASGIIVYTDGTNFFSSGKANDSLVASDGSGNSVQIDEDGLKSDDGTIDFYFLKGGQDGADILCTVEVTLRYVSGTTVTVEINDNVGRCYNGASNFTTAATASGGTDSGVYFGGSYITIADDVLSPSGSYDVQLIAVLSCSTFGSYQISTSGPPVVTAYAYGGYPNSALYLYFYNAGAASNIYTMLNASNDIMRFQIAFLARIIVP